MINAIVQIKEKFYYFKPARLICEILWLDHIYVKNSQQHCSVLGGII